jgi:hypothetical protein
MATGLIAERVRRDVEVVARAGLDLDTFLEEAVESVGRAVPWASACLATHDPGTHLLTSARKYGYLRDTNSHDHEFGLIEYGTVEPTAFTELAAAPVPAAGVHLTTGGDIEPSTRPTSPSSPPSPRTSCRACAPGCWPGSLPRRWRPRLPRVPPCSSSAPTTRSCR